MLDVAACFVSNLGIRFLYVSDHESFAISMRRLVASALLIILLGAIQPLIAFSECPGTSMVINPSILLAVSTTMNYSITFDCPDAASFPNILLVMTRASLVSLTGPIIVNWSGGSAVFARQNFQEVDDGFVPPSSVTSFDSGRYTLDEIRMNLGMNGTAGGVYCVFGSFLSEVVGRTAQSFSVLVPSENPQVLVLALARTFGSTSFNIRSSLPLDIIPELVSVLPELALLCFMTLISSCLASRFRKQKP